MGRDRAISRDEEQSIRKQIQHLNNRYDQLDAMIGRAWNYASDNEEAIDGLRNELRAWMEDQTPIMAPRPSEVSASQLSLHHFQPRAKRSAKIVRKSPSGQQAVLEAV